MSGIVIASSIVGGLALLSGAGYTYGAYALYKKTIPRQTESRVSRDEVGDAKKWEGYIQLIHERKDWLAARESEHLTIKSRDNLTLHADLYPADNESDTIVLCSHGYTSTGWDSCSTIGSYFVKKGYDALIVDNRAHGKSEGDYVGFGILDRYDLLKWIEYIRERYDNKKKIILYGVSMGGATVLMTAGFEGLTDVKAIIADCAFTSPYDVFGHIMQRDYHMPKGLVMGINGMITRKKAGYGFKDYSTLDAVKSTNIPILFVHGAEDTFVPTWMSEKNYEACNSPKQKLIIENAGHAASYYEAHELYEETVDKFLAEHIINV